jgi:hypothetical protein
MLQRELIHIVISEQGRATIHIDRFNCKQVKRTWMGKSGVPQIIIQ